MNNEQKFRQHIYTYSRKISNEVGEHFNMKFESNSLDLIAELAYKKLTLYGADLEAFQKHAKRSTVTIDDVKLLVRRNDSLRKMVEEKVDYMQINKPVEATTAVKRKRKTTASSK
ncbi:hypothetical protein ABEB36_005543 [Hypothenemus hampei]|uniref:Centromere protein S n=1 Tax=Hypothenemus hampei TaxID=57062 RepID=A0ABD1EZQ9_HYPHA